MTLNKEAFRFLRYLSFKMYCLQLQEANPLTLDVEKAQGHYDELMAVIDEKSLALSKVMPKVVSKYKNKPKVMHKKDGTYSVAGKDWCDTLKLLKLPDTTEGTIPVEWKEGNPGSTPQVKEWLESLGWVPCTFKYQRNKITGEEKKIPQVRYNSPSDPRKGELTDSVLRLKSREPAIEVLEGLTVAKHRSGVFEGYLKAHKEGMMVASAGGLTNTLRLKHRAPIVNLPGVDAVWGKEIRGCIVAPDGEILVGSDVSSLEDNTKRHYMEPLDPTYVEAMNQPGYDPHMKLLVIAGRITEEDYEFYITKKREKAYK